MESTIRHAERHLVLIDNYDSFTWNLVQLFYEFQLRVTVVRNDRLSVSEVGAASPDLICISPGPGTPDDSGICPDLVHRLHHRVPIFGVCLGMQVINEVFGGITTRAPTPIHGKRSQVTHDGSPLFDGLPSPFPAARYHSLQVDMAEGPLVPLAHAEDGVVMALRHAQRPIFGVQFHPESFMTPLGDRLVANLLTLTLEGP